MDSVLNKFSEYIYFYITLRHKLCCLFLKSLKAFSVSLSISQIFCYGGSTLPKKLFLS